MANDDSKHILIVINISQTTESRPVERGVGERLARSGLNIISMSILKTNMQRFFDKLQDILNTRYLWIFGIRDRDLSADHCLEGFSIGSRWEVSSSCSNVRAIEP
jgi:hypothetical protein